MDQSADAENDARNRAIGSFAHGRPQGFAFRSVDPARSGTKSTENALFAAYSNRELVKNRCEFQ
jgi:hypothetical protein